MRSLLHRLFEGRDPVGGHEGSSKVASNHSILRNRYRQDKGDLYLGRAYGKDRNVTLGAGIRLGHRSEQHLMLLGGTRAGKGRRILMQNVLDYPGGQLINDVKGEFSIVCAEALAQRGYRVIINDPFDQCANVLGDRSLDKFRGGWNPLFEVNPYEPGADILLQSLSHLLIKDEGTSGDAGVYWRDCQRAVVQGLTAWSLVFKSKEQQAFVDQKIDEAEKSGRRFTPAELTLYERGMVSQYCNLMLASLFDQQEDEFLQELVEQMCSYNDNETTYVGGLINAGGQNAKKLLNKDNDPLAFRSLLTTMGGNFMWAKSRGMQESICAYDFKFSMRHFQEEEKVVNFMVVPKTYIPVVHPWIRMNFCMALAMGELCPSSNKYRTNLVVDEGPQLGYVPEIEQAFAIGAERHRMIYVCQDLTQVKKHYGESWETFIGNSAQMVLSVSDLTTTKYFSEKSGFTYKKDQKTKEKGEQKVPLFSHDEIELITHPERKVGLYFEGGAQPRRVGLTNYDDEKRAGRDYRVHPRFAKKSDRLPREQGGQALAVENQGVVKLEDHRKPKVKATKVRKVKPVKVRTG